MGIQRRAASSRRSVALGIIFVMALMVLSFLAVLSATKVQAQENTTAQNQTTTAETTAAENNRADRVRDSENFRCVEFLRVVRDERGALLRQYRDDELIVQRFEQCVSGDVLVNTIPDRKLPFTGGMPLLGLAAIGLVALIAGIVVLRALIRRAG